MFAAMRALSSRTVAAGLICAAASGLATAVWAQTDAPPALRVYGPGGPLPAVQEAAELFGKRHGVLVQVTGGPTDQWRDQARSNADLIYSGSENMMTGFVEMMQGQVVESTITPLYLRPSAILVRPGNPKRIAGFRDLLKPGIKVMVVSGAGQVGMWEDVAGRSGSIDTVRDFRRNIAVFAANSGDAKRIWQQNRDLDAWLIWSIWWVANRELADMVAVEDELAIYRDVGVALTRRGQGQPLAGKFLEFLESPEGARIFSKWGWLAGGAAPAADRQRRPE